ncbi:hypothetical protein PIIN_09329 [Serendipita indica DSM 11827]|uniref:Uncharacterized protein n=1 Tax=Serendipita indica (strain DSM 11827) TaxID=1109443 RepID=G4TVK2_SERID|nr:hypothetical protein PIIN_09329 [Serendipita indica DSM 11827]
MGATIVTSTQVHGWTDFDSSHIPHLTTLSVGLGINPIRHGTLLSLTSLTVTALDFNGLASLSAPRLRILKVQKLSNNYTHWPLSETTWLAAYHFTSRFLSFSSRNFGNRYTLVSGGYARDTPQDAASEAGDLSGER